MTLFEELRAKHQDYSPNKSAAWFNKNVTVAMQNVGPQKFLGQNITLQTTQVKPGSLMMFGYDAKNKEELPFYDKFPLLLPFHVDAKHFIGINLHYMPPAYRIAILDKLLGFTKNEMIPDKLKIQLSWTLLKNISKNNATKFAVKKYLHGYVKTRFVSIPTKDWVLACYLPLARFAKADEKTVWSKMRG